MRTTGVKRLQVRKANLKTCASTFSLTAFFYVYLCIIAQLIKAVPNNQDNQEKSLVITGNHRNLENSPRLLKSSL